MKEATKIDSVHDDNHTNDGEDEEAAKDLRSPAQPLPPQQQQQQAESKADGGQAK